MRKLRLTKIITSLLIIGSVLSLNQIGVSAEWKQDSKGISYREGSSWLTGWHPIDGNFYYFNTNGYMVTNLNIDGMQIGSDGKCQIANGVNKTTSNVIPYGFDNKAIFSDGYLYNSTNGKSFTMSGIEYKEGFTLTGTASALFNLGGKYDNIQFRAGSVYSKYIVDATITIYLDGKESVQIDLKHDDMPKAITIPVNKANQMKIQITKNEPISEYGFIDIIGH